MNYQNLLIDVKDNVAVVTINRPDKLNSLNMLTMDELFGAFTWIKSNGNIAVVVLTGKGEKAFVAGADIAELNTLDIIKGREFSERGQQIFNLIENLDKPVIAAVNGFALGGGCNFLSRVISGLPRQMQNLGSLKLILELFPAMAEHSV